MNILFLKDCYGCGVCSIVCPPKIISINLNKDGFYTPYIENESKCINCGLCLKVCAYEKEEIISLSSFDVHSYAGWSNNKNIRFDCSSGGIGFELGKYLINQGYKACGVRYNAERQRAEHFIATTVEEFMPTIGSKYIPSYTVKGFSGFTRNEKFFVTGTPCQIDSLRHYLRIMKMEDNFVLMDFFCHGVPSMLMWNKYIVNLENKVGRKIKNICWRNKKTGWHDSWVMGICDDTSDTFSYFSLMSKGDLFYKFFLENRCLGKACYDKCKYKMLSSAADIRIGDLWGNEYKDNEEGVSGIIVYSNKGYDIINNLSTCSVVAKPLHIITESQMKKNAIYPSSYRYVKNQLKKNAKIEAIHKVATVIDAMFDGLPNMCTYYLRKIFQKLGVK